MTEFFYFDLAFCIYTLSPSLHLSETDCILYILYIYPEVLVGARPERKEVLLLTLYSVRAVVKQRVEKDLRRTMYQLKRE